MRWVSRHRRLLESAADPGGSVAAALDPAPVIDSVVYPAMVLSAPGVVQVAEGSRFGPGEVSGR